MEAVGLYDIEGTFKIGKWMRLFKFSAHLFGESARSRGKQLPVERR